MKISHGFPQIMRNVYELACLLIIIWDVCLKTLYGGDIDMRSYMSELFFHMYGYISKQYHVLLFFFNKQVSLGFYKNGISSADISVCISKK